MTVAGKINALVISVAIVAGGLVLAIIAHREYAAAKQPLLQRSVDSVADLPALQIALYQDNSIMQNQALQQLLSISAAIQYAALLSPEGRMLALQEREPGARDPAKTFSTLRGGAPLSDNTLTTEGMTARYWDMVVPVMSAINPQDLALTSSDLSKTISDVGSAQSLYILGYVHLGIDRTALLRSVARELEGMAILTCLFILICACLSFYMTRRITAPFDTIVRMADDVAAGRPVQTKGLERNSEFKDLVSLLNSIIGGLHTYKTKMDVDHHLLSMKVEERTSQLSKRNQELNRAVREVTETKERMRKLAYYDSLTALPNRRLFTEQLDLLLRLAKRNKERIGLLFLDLDNFKRINDSLGHSAGDLLLREVGKRLSQCVRESDVVAHYVEPKSQIDVSRLGGDEFTVVLNQLDRAESAGLVAQRLLDALTKPMTIEGHELVVTPSIGVAIAPNHAENVEDLLKAADTAMYYAKSSGKNNFVVYSEDMDADSVDRLTLENDLRKALERDELVLHYQPQVDTLTGTVVGAEALVRWEHPEMGMIPPFKFVPLAEEMGLIGALGEWVMAEACRKMVELQSLGLDLPKVSVNVSSLQFTPSFTDHVAQVLKETGLKPMRLELELTEGIMMDGAEATLAALNKLKELGVQLSIDDFGTGYSSLSYLSRFPLDELKIDRSFVVEMENSESDAGLVIAIIAMARSLGLELVAEGVETHEQYRFLRQHGASVIQGYLFSKPVPIDDLIPLLAPGYFSASTPAAEHA